MTKLSIVTTMYYSENYVEEFYTRSLKTLNDIGIYDYEFIFVDDGSPDDSLKEAIKLYNNDSCVTVVELSRNFGHHKAIMTGLGIANGDYIFLIDIDLEEEPELLKIFWEELHKEENKNVDVIYGVQSKRKGDWFERWSGDLFYRLHNMVCDQGKVEKNLTTVRIMKNNFVKELLKFKEHDFYFAPICSLVGFNQIPIMINKKSTSLTTYSFLKKYHLAINSIFSFSNKPLYFIFYLGLLITVVSFLVVIYALFQKLIFNITIDGWASMIASIWLLGGIIILFIGISAIYISKIFEQTKNKPFTIIKTLYNGSESQ